MKRENTPSKQYQTQLNTVAAHQLCLLPDPLGLLGNQFYAISLPQQTIKKHKRNENYNAALALAKSDALNQKLEKRARGKRKQKNRNTLKSVPTK